MCANLLIAEDDVRVGRAMKRFFRNHHLSVAVARSVAEARELVAGSTKWAGAVVDVGLPDGNGLEVLETFRARWWSAPALVLTGHNEWELVNRAQRAGAEYALKPIDLSCLRAFALRLTASRGTRDLARAVAILARRHGLTEGETRVVLEAVRGRPRGDIPRALSLAEDTVKSQVRTLLRKSGNFELSDVVRSVWQAVAEQAEPD